MAETTITPSQVPQPAPEPIPAPAFAPAPATVVVPTPPVPSAPVLPVPPTPVVPAPVPEPVQPKPDPEPASEPVSDPQPEDQVDETESEPEGEAPGDHEVTFSWHASEYVHHHKNASWYIGLFAITGVLTVGAVILKSWLSIGLFLSMAGALAALAGRPPKVLLYELTASELIIDGKAFPLEEFRSFGVLPGEEWHSIDLEPTKRFMLRLSLLFEDADYDEIVGHLEQFLPRADRQPDLIERITRYLRF